MDKELEQQAIATFVQQPEVYAEFLNNNGQDGSQIPVEEIKKDPDTYVQAFQKDKKFHDTVVGLFQAIVKSQQKSSMFREGGKFDYLKKFQAGGSIVDPTYRTVINAPGDTLRTKFYKYRTDEMQTYPNGNVRYTTRDNAGDNHSWSPDSNPSFIQRLWFGNQTASPEIINNWNQLMENHKNDLVMDKTKQLQEGGRLKRRDMFNQASANRGFTRQQARFAYNNARRAGLSRDAAMRAVIGRPQLANIDNPNNYSINVNMNDEGLNDIGLEPIEIVYDIPVPVVPKKINKKVDRFANAAPAQNLSPNETIKSAQPSNITFSNSRNVKNNRTSSNTSSQNNTVTHELPESERAAHEAYIQSLNRNSNQYTISPERREDINAATQAIWNGNNFLFYQKPRMGEYIIQNPGVYITEPTAKGIAWRSPNPRYLTSVSYEKSGGKLSEENEINEKYIKDSVKAGQEASKKMTDLKNKHKAELKKIK